MTGLGASFEVLAPSDVARLQPGTQCHLGGRIVHAHAQTWVVADALATVTITLPPLLEQTAQVGDLVVARVLVSEDRVQLIDVQSHQPQPEPTRDSEFGRLALTRRGQWLSARSRAKAVVHSFFRAERFVEVDTPSAARCPGLDAHVCSWSGLSLGAQQLYLVTSPELHMKRLLCAGLPRIYQLAHCFRAEEQGSWHAAEFTMLEWYRAFATWETTMRDTEAVLRHMAAQIADPDTQRLLEAPFERLQVREAFKTFAGISDALDLAHSDEDQYFRLMIERVEPALSRQPRPIFLTHYPLCQAGLAVASESVPNSAERYELYFRGLELCNGFSELVEPGLQRSRFEAELVRRRATGEPLYPIDERFLSALAQGMPPSSGNALGFDRAVAALLNVSELSEVLAFSDSER